MYFRSIFLKILFWKCFSLCLFLPTFGQVPAMRQLSLMQGLPQSEVTCLLQDSRGIIWIGTSGGGLVEYISGQMRIINSQNGLTDDFISDLVETTDGRILIATTYGGVKVLNNRQIHPLKKKLDNLDGIKKLVVIEDQWYGISDRLLLRLNEDSTKFRTEFTFPTPNQPVFAVSAVGGRWILVSREEGLWAIDIKSPARTVLLAKETHLGGRKIVGLNVISDKSLALLADDGYSTVLHFSQGWPLQESWIKGNIDGLRPGEKISHAIFSLGQMVKWVATNQRRILSHKGEIIDMTHSRLGNYFPVNCIMADFNGTLWIGTSGSGIIIKSANTGYSFENIEALADPNLKAIYASQDGKILVGGKNKGLFVYHKATSQISNYLPQKSIYSIAEKDDGYLIGSEGEVLLVSKADYSIKKQYPLPGKVIVLAPQKNGLILAGTYGDGGYLIRPTGEIEAINKNRENPLYVYGFEKRPNGTFLIPSNSGLFTFNPTTLKLDSFPTPATIGKLFFLSRTDRKGNHWFSTPYGLAGLVREKWVRIDQTQGLTSKLIYILEIDATGNIWIGTNRGLDRISVNEEGTPEEIRNIGPEEGFEGFESNMRASHLQQDVLYVGTIQGLIAMPVKSKVLDPFPIVPAIVKLSVGYPNGEWKDVTQKTGTWFAPTTTTQLLEEGARGIQFSFKCINSIYPEKLRYSYRLIGKSNNWSQPDEAKEAIFLDLEPGEYQFEVKSTYDGKVFSPTAELKIRVETGFFQNKYLLVLLISGILFLLIWGIRGLLKTRKHHIFSDKYLDIPERTGQIILLLLALIQPVTYFFIYVFNAVVPYRPYQVFGSSAIILGLLLATLFNQRLKKEIRSMVRAGFLLLVASTGADVIQSDLHPFFVANFLFFCGLGFLVFQDLLQLSIFITALNLLALSTHWLVADPQYNPVAFQISTFCLSVILFLMNVVRKAGEENLQFSSKVVNTGSVLVLGFQSDGFLIFSSQNLFQQLGYNAWEVAGRNWWNQAMPFNDDVLNMLQIVVEGKDAEFKVRLRAKSGEVKVYKLNARTINPKVVVVTGSDVSESQKLETRFKHLVERAPDAIFQTDFNGHIVYANPQTSLILGVPNEELIGRNFHEFFREDLKQSIAKVYNQQFRNQIPSTYNEFPIVTRNGQVRWLGFQVSMLKSEDGMRIEGYLSIARDITERLEAEQLIQHQHKNITDSLNYASRIKSALLPGEDALKTIFTNYEVFNQPKDIIGGDFYWLLNAGKRHLFVVGDCTGHGVPGAFMTTIAIGILRQIVREEPEWNLENILALFNRTLIRLMGGNAENEVPDFAELALVSIDFEQNKLQYLSSGIPMFRVRKHELEAFKSGSRGYNFKYDYKGDCQTMSIQPGDAFFICTDGVYDQIGGPENKRLNRNRLMEILQNSDSVNLKLGMAYITQELKTWQGALPQIDDRLLISFRF